MSAVYPAIQLCSSPGKHPSTTTAAAIASSTTIVTGCTRIGVVSTAGIT